MVFRSTENRPRGTGDQGVGCQRIGVTGQRQRLAGELKIDGEVAKGDRASGRFRGRSGYEPKVIGRCCNEGSADCAVLGVKRAAQLAELALVDQRLVDADGRPATELVGELLGDE